MSGWAWIFLVIPVAVLFGALYSPMQRKAERRSTSFRARPDEDQDSTAMKEWNRWRH